MVYLGLKHLIQLQNVYLPAYQGDKNRERQGHKKSLNRRGAPRLPSTKKKKRIIKILLRNLFWRKIVFEQICEKNKLLRQLLWESILDKYYETTSSMINMHARFLHPAAAGKPSNKYYLFILIVCLVKVLPIFPELKIIRKCILPWGLSIFIVIYNFKMVNSITLSHQQLGKCRTLLYEVWWNLLLQSLVHIDFVYNNPRGILNRLCLCCARFHSLTGSRCCNASV